MWDVVLRKKKDKAISKVVRIPTSPQDWLGTGLVPRDDTLEESNPSRVILAGSSGPASCPRPGCHHPSEGLRREPVRLPLTDRYCGTASFHLSLRAGQARADRPLRWGGGGGAWQCTALLPHRLRALGPPPAPSPSRDLTLPRSAKTHGSFRRCAAYCCNPALREDRSAADITIETCGVIGDGHRSADSLPPPGGPDHLEPRLSRAGRAPDSAVTEAPATRRGKQVRARGRRRLLSPALFNPRLICECPGAWGRGAAGASLAEERRAEGPSRRAHSQRGKDSNPTTQAWGVPLTRGNNGARLEPDSPWGPVGAAPQETEETRENLIPLTFPTVPPHKSPGVIHVDVGMFSAPSPCPHPPTTS